MTTTLQDTRGGAVQADCICIVYLCVPVCVIEGGGAKLDPSLTARPVSNFDGEMKMMQRRFQLEPGFMCESVRRYVEVGAVVAAAVLTPSTDPFTQMLLAVPLMSLYLGEGEHGD